MKSYGDVLAQAAQSAPMGSPPASTAEDLGPPEYDVMKDPQFAGMHAIIGDHGNREFIMSQTPEGRAMIAKMLREHKAHPNSY